MPQNKHAATQFRHKVNGGGKKKKGGGGEKTHQFYLFSPP